VISGNDRADDLIKADDLDLIDDKR